MKNILQLNFGGGTFKTFIKKLLNNSEIKVVLIDHFFEKTRILGNIPINDNDYLHFVDSTEELTTDYVNSILNEINMTMVNIPEMVIGIGGGTALDFAKAISNLFTNKGKAEDYQGWDLVKNKGIYKIGIPTLSGTGSESSRTCVMINKKKGIKLGMNSDQTIFDELVLDSELSKTVPKDQYFYTGMDTYIHCTESLNGRHHHSFSDAYSRQALALCKDVFTSDDIMSDPNRDKLMIASYMGGVAIANSHVGLVHPLSSGLSVLLGIHHCEANCIAMRAVEEFYPKDYKEFWNFVDKQGIKIPEGICSDLTDEEYEQLFASTIIHEKPLTNALGKDFKDILTKDKVLELFQKM